ncbi:PorP/SprF family type IX secretion system membrane protein [Myroides sp. LJL119]
MNKIFKKGYIALALVIGQIGFAQQGLSVTTEYLADNYYLLNPAMAGIKNSAQFRLSTRQQWSGVDDAPSLFTFAGSARIAERSGVGIIAYNDKNGYHSNSGFKLTYSHFITFSESRYDLNLLSFGISAGFDRTALDETEFGGIFDPNINGTITTKGSVFSVDVGAAYHYQNLFAMLSVQNLANSKNDLYDDAQSNNYRKYLLGVGYDFGNTKYGTGWIYEPSTLIKYTEELEQLTIDLNMKVYRQFDFGRVYVGASYRTSTQGADYITSNGKEKTQRMQYIAPLLGANYKNVSFSYSYVETLGDLKITNSGMHLFTVGINLFAKRSSLDCNCPGVQN